MGKGNRAAAKEMIAKATKEVEVSDKDLQEANAEIAELKEGQTFLQEQVNAHAEEIETLRAKVLELSTSAEEQTSWQEQINAHAEEIEVLRVAATQKKVAKK